MSEAPERIWAVTKPDDISADILGDVYAQQVPDGMVGTPVEYVRADRIEELEAKLAKALAEMRNVDAYLTKLQAPGTEPLNSVNAATSKANRNIYTAMVRNEAREAWASLGNTLAELTGGKDRAGRG